MRKQLGRMLVLLALATAPITVQADKPTWHGHFVVEYQNDRPPKVTAFTTIFQPSGLGNTTMNGDAQILREELKLVPFENGWWGVDLPKNFSYAGPFHGMSVKTSSTGVFGLHKQPDKEAWHMWLLRRFSAQANLSKIPGHLYLLRCDTGRYIKCDGPDCK